MKMFMFMFFHYLFFNIYIYEKIQPIIDIARDLTAPFKAVQSV